MRLAVPLAVFVLAPAALAGCGSSGDSASTGGAAPSKAGGAKAPVGAATQSCVLNAGGASELRAVGVPCREAQKVALTWGEQPACSASADASRSACSVGRYRCLGARTDRGLAVACARPGHSISFRSKR
jgi:hypothetical protein